MRRISLFLLVIALPAVAAAQAIQPAAPEPFRKWDVGGGVTIRFGEYRDRVIPAGSWVAEAGRYWTPHLKASVLVMTAGQQTYGGFSYNGVSATSIEYVTAPAAYGVGITYQFFDNEFVHPYLTAGARFASVNAATTISTYSARLGYQVTTLSGPDRVEADPVVGGGFKSYFGNGRAFMRTELLFSSSPDGTRHAVLLIGSGVDF
jgi:hypothetical protein